MFILVSYRQCFVIKLNTRYNQRYCSLHVEIIVINCHLKKILWFDSASIIVRQRLVNISDTLLTEQLMLT